MNTADWCTSPSYQNYRSIPVGAADSDGENFLSQLENATPSAKNTSMNNTYNQCKVFDIEQDKLHESTHKKYKQKRKHGRAVSFFTARPTNKAEDDRLLQADDFRQQRRDICWRRRLQLEGFFWLMGGLFVAVGTLLFVLNSVYCFIKVPPALVVN
jgi:hypothetical protein